MGYGRGGKGRAGGHTGGDGGGARGGAHKPFWRQFVDPSDDPAVRSWCKNRVQQFLDGGAAKEEIEWLSNEYRNTIRVMAPDMGVAWLKVDKGVYALARSTREGVDTQSVLMQLLRSVAKTAEEAGGRISSTWAQRVLDQELWIAASCALKIRNLKGIADTWCKECQEIGLRMNDRRNTFFVGEADGYEDAVFVRFDKARVAEARRCLAAALQRLPSGSHRKGSHLGVGFLQRPFKSIGPEELLQERSSAAFQHFLPARARLPAFTIAKGIVATVRQQKVTLILGATGCGKTTQIPQFLLEDAASRGEECRILATQPRRISAVSVAERVATERGGRLGEKVAYKIRFEDNISEETQLIFCTVGILLKVMQSNPNLDGATHIIVDEVHERDLHTDFFLTLLRRVLDHRKDVKVILMSATVDPSAFQEYFTDCTTVEIPGKTNYPIEELFLEDVLGELPQRLLQQWRVAASRAPSVKVSPFSQGPLPNLPDNPERVFEKLPSCDFDICTDLSWAHKTSPEEIDFDLVVALVEAIHKSGEEGGILIFMPGWAEIVKVLENLQGSPVGKQLQVHPLHSRIPIAEQQAIFQPPPHGKRKVIVSTILAESSITVEDIVFVIDLGRSRATFFNKDSKVSALRTVWYSKASGFQRRGRSGRCRPGKWYRLYSSFQWEAMPEYELPEMLRSPLEELCLEVASLHLGPPASFLKDAISPPPEDIVEHAVALLYNLGAVTDTTGARLTALGEKLSRIQVHPMLGKMLLLGGLFRCFEPVMTVCAALGYKSPFVCPMGKEKEANEAKRRLADGSQSDLVALSNAYGGWRQRGARFANENYLSHPTLDYIHRLRMDLRGAATDFLHTLPEDHSDKMYLADVCRAVLVAGLYPNLAYIRKFGKGHSLEGLSVCVHPGSVNAKVSYEIVAFYEIQETTARWLYDTTVVPMAPCFLFAPSLEELHRGKRVVFRLGNLTVAVDPQVADDLLKLRTLLADFINRSVGHRLTEVHTTATDALSRLFSERAGGGQLEGGSDDEETNETGTPRAAGESGVAAGPSRAGASRENTWGSSRSSWQEGQQGWTSRSEPQGKRQGGSQAWSGGTKCGKWPRR